MALSGPTLALNCIILLTNVSYRVIEGHIKNVTFFGLFLYYQQLNYFHQVTKRSHLVTLVTNAHKGNKGHKDHISFLIQAPVVLCYEIRALHDLKLYHSAAGVTFPPPVFGLDYFQRSAVHRQGKARLLKAPAAA